MHTVEALLVRRRRARTTPSLRDAGAADRHPGRARPRPAATTGGSPSTSTTTWTPLLEYNVDEPAHPFRPVRRDDRPLAGVGPAGAAPARRARATRAPDWLLDDAVSLFDAVGPRGLGGRRRGRVRLHRRLGRAARSYASGCTGSPPRPPPPRPRCTRRPATRRTPTWYAHLVGAHRRLLPSTPSTARGATSCRPTNRPSSVDLGRQAGHLPRVPGHADPAAAADARPWRPRSPGDCQTSIQAEAVDLRRARLRPRRCRRR